MIYRFVSWLALLLVGSGLTLSSYSAESTPAMPADKSAEAESAEKAAPPIHDISPGPMDGQIAAVTAKVLEGRHYSHLPLDESVSGKFLDRYLDTLDPQHIHFLQNDLSEFASYRTNLSHLTLPRHGAPDASPGCVIFNRFLQRLDQRVAYADELLKTEKFTFDTDERITINRHELPYPADLDEAKKLWRERLRFEYLQERLGKLTAKKKPETAAATEKPQDHAAAAAKPKTSDEEIVETLSKRYHRSLRGFTDWNSDDVLQTYLDALAHVYDPHSDYFGHVAQDSFAISMNLSLFGIGAELVSEDGYCVIRRLLPGGPAEKSKKINVKDKIVAVAQSNQPPVDVVDMSLTKAVQMIRGPKGTEVRLTLIPAGAASSEKTVLSLIRDEIPLEEQAAKAKIIELTNDRSRNLRLGVIDLPSFYAPFNVGSRRMELATRGGDSPGKFTAADVALLLRKLKQENVSGVILDLRRNGGGSLEEAIKLTGLFIKQGPVVQVRDSSGAVQEDDDNDPSVAYDGPLIVLTSRFSASASEIVAGALQDYGRALVVGDSSTHGKGTVQEVDSLSPYIRVPENTPPSDPGSVKVTIKKFYRASGASTQLEGVKPDIILPSILNEMKDIGEKALDNPLPWDTIRSAKYDHLSMVAPYLPELQRRTVERMASEKDFDYIREDIAKFKKDQADKAVSLNEKQRLKEIEENEARDKARDKERLARAEPQEKVYELTLKQAEQPGLPPPVQHTNTMVAKITGGKVPVTGGVGTNSASVTASANFHSGEPGVEADDEEKPPAVDVPLEEAEHILVDYISVLPKESAMTGGPQM
jgi:carboxyl-terminal processing protease